VPLPDWAVHAGVIDAGAPLLFVRTIITASVTILSISALAINTYNPFIYFRF
jgi:hypothetical protein